MTAYTVSGAGTVGYRGDYAAINSQYEGHNSYQIDSTHCLHVATSLQDDSSYWVINNNPGTSISSAQSAAYWQAAVYGAQVTPPLTGWQIGTGAAPAPTLAIAVPGGGGSGGGSTRVPDLMPFF